MMHARHTSWLLGVLAGILITISFPEYGRAQTSGYAVTPSSASVVSGGTMTVAWNAPSTHSTNDWIGLFVANMPSAGNTIVAYKYVPSGSTGIISFTMPTVSVPQTYEFRYFLNNGWTKTASSTPFMVSKSGSTSPSSPSSQTSTTSQPTTSSSITGTVSPTQPTSTAVPSLTGYTMLASPVTIAPGGTTTLSWKAPGTHSTRDWVGLFLTSKPTAGNTFVTWQYVPAGSGGILRFVVPHTATPQQYEFRYMIDNSFSVVAKSNALMVSTGTSAAPSSSPSAGGTSTTTTPPPIPSTPSITPTPSSAGTVCPNELPLAFPTAEGFGRCAQGGRGGRVIDVTNLNNNGPGSLRQCAEVESGPRTCRLTVPGTISLGSYDIVVRNDYLTIDGSAVPVAVKDGGFDVRASHTVIRHLRVRPGPKSWLERGSNANGITYRSSEAGARTHDHICDHCSISWGTDDLIAVINGTYNVTIQDSILSEGLISGAACENCGSRGLLIGTGNTETVSVIRTLNAHNFIRFPNATSGQIDFVNNVDYNGNGSSAQIAPYYGPVKINMIGNYWKDGPSAIPFNLTYNVIRTIGGMNYSAQSGIFVQDNVGRSRPNGTSPENKIIWGDNGGIPVQTARYSFPVVTTVSALQAYEDVLNRSGAQPRDSVDARVVNDVRNGTGAWISDPMSVGGWPVLPSAMP